MKLFRGVVLAAIVIGVGDSAAAQQTTPAPIPAPSPAQPGAPPAPGTPTLPAPGPAVPPATTAAAQLPVTPAPLTLTPACPAPVPPATAPARAFTATTGLLMHQVTATRVVDFDKFIAYVQDALAKTTNATLRQQARGWKFYKSPELGPNGDVIYTFVLDPAVPCVDYALGPILAEAYPDPAQLGEIWSLYKGSVRGGGTILNLVPVEVKAPEPILTPPSTPVAPVPPASATPAPATQKPAAAKP
jgi:hypothetical protein